ncbi:MAG TPA: DUF4142 domain-containing protein [Tepidisphaeraceae bacterium]|nr:DUF4142 domain-containing protein [Tepidisphaeraceae bacterium]
MKPWNRSALAVAVIALAAVVGGCESLEQLGGKRNDSLSDADNRFFKRAAISDMTEARTSRLALQKSDSQRVKQFAQMMVDDHAKVSREMARLADRKGVDLPKQLDAPSERVVDTLAGTSSGQEFDRAYIRAQVTAHEEAVANYEDAAEMAKDQDVRRFAKEHLPTLREHLRMAKNIADKL